MAYYIGVYCVFVGMPPDVKKGKDRVFYRGFPRRCVYALGRYRFTKKGPKRPFRFSSIFRAGFLGSLELLCP